MRFSTFPLLLLLLACTIAGCKKEEGEGGNSSIRGKVYANDYNSTFTQLIGKYWAPDEDVFIIYGDDVTYSDKVSTNYDGTYEFKYLRPGDYRVYSYSKDSTMNTAKYPSGVRELLYQVKITKRKQTVEVPTMVIFK